MLSSAYVDRVRFLASELVSTIDRAREEGSVGSASSSSKDSDIISIASPSGNREDTPDPNNRDSNNNKVKGSPELGTPSTLRGPKVDKGKGLEVAISSESPSFNPFNST